MINPATVMKLLNERKTFLENNPELYPFMKKWLGNDMKKGTVIEIRVTPPEGGTAESVKIEVTEDNMEFMQTMRQLFD